MSYTKLFSHIITSSIWSEDSDTKVVWVTMLALANKHGEVMASIPGLAKVAGISIEGTQKAIQKFMSPDVFSRTKEAEGRRIEEIDGGWFIINYIKHREMASAEDERIKNVERQRRFRNRHGSNAKVTARNGDVTPHIDNAEAEADSKKKTVASSAKKPTSSLLSDEDWIKSLSEDPSYRGIDVDTEYGKMVRWCGVNNKQPTRKRFVNWLNRTDRPLNTSRIEQLKSAPTREDYLNGRLQ